MRNYRQILEQRKGQLKSAQAMLMKVRVDLLDFEGESERCEQAQAIIQNVAQLTQEELKYHIGELVSLALAAVWDDPYEFEVEFVQRRGQTECDMWFKRDGERINPMEDSGGGAVDVACFALRVSLWSLKRPRPRALLVLDEPLKWLKGGDLPEKGALMIKEISEKLGLQVIMISHIPDQIEGADKVHTVTIKNGVSKCV